MTKNEVRVLVDTNFCALEAVCGQANSTCEELLSRLVATCERQEREHLAFGRRLLGRAPKRQHSIKLTAYYFAVKCASEDYRHLGTQDALSYLAGLREDYQIGAMLGAALRERGHAFSPSVKFHEIDYSVDFAAKE